jgi:adenylosuccinate lyase
LRFLGAKGATGTQASFLRLFDGDSAKVEELDAALARRAGFRRRQMVSGQTYSRKQDDRVVHALSSLAQSAHKIATDLRLLQHEGELEEPFEASQVGSSSMPYKRNPMRAERICSLARHVIALSLDTAMTAATQWLERTLDDSANKRIAVPEAFLAADAILTLLENVVGGLVVHPEVCARRLAEEAPFLASENVLMEAVRRGGDRQGSTSAASTRPHRPRPHATASRGPARPDRARSRVRPVRGRRARPSPPEKLDRPRREQVETFVREELDPALAGAGRPPGATVCGVKAQGRHACRAISRFADCATSSSRPPIRSPTRQLTPAWREEGLASWYGGTTA